MSQVTERSTILSSGRVTLILGVVTLVGAGLRFHALGAHSLWIDEGASVLFATMPWRLFLHTLWAYQGNMTLYYFLLREWIHLGDSEFMVRSLSVLFSVLTIPAMYGLGKRLFDRATGLTAAALLSVHSFHILWSQQARSYSLLLFLLVLSAYLLSGAVESNSRAGWVAFSVVAALSVYAHLFAVLVLAAFALCILFCRPYRIPGRDLLLTAILFEHMVAPMAIFVLLRHSNQIDWIEKPSWAEFSGFLELLTSQGGVILVVAYLSLCALAFFLAVSPEQSGKESFALRLLGLWLVLPPLLTLAASPIKHLFDPGFMVICVPAMVMLAARGLVKLGNVQAVRYWAAAAIFAVVASLSLLSDARPPMYRITLSADWRSAVNYVLGQEQPQDGAVFYVPNDYPFLYYTHRAEAQHKVATAPDILYPPDPWQPLTREEIENVTLGRHRVWVFLSNESSDPREEVVLQSALNERFTLLDKHVFSGDAMPVTVELYGATSAARPSN